MINGPGPNGYCRIDYVAEDGPVGMEFLLRPPLLCQNTELAQRIADALNAASVPLRPQDSADRRPS